MEPEGCYQKSVAARLAAKETFQDKFEYLLGFRKNEFNNIHASYLSEDFDEVDSEYTHMGFSNLPKDASERAEWMEKYRQVSALRDKNYQEVYTMWTKLTDAERAVKYEEMFNKSWARWLAAK